jgi:glycosyltransferase involved in cell wall biosynthesis
MSESPDSDLLITFVVPALNEVGRIDTAARNVLHGARDAGIEDRVEIILLDGGSTDATLAEMQRFAQDSYYSCELFVHSFERNLGVGNAFRYGVATARGRMVCLVPGDGVFPEEAIRLLCEAVTVDEGGMILTQRLNRHSRHRMRRAASLAFSHWVSWLVAQPIPDPHSLFAMPRAAVQDVCEGLWGPWFPDAAQRLDNDYHLDVLVLMASQVPVTAVVPITSITLLESNSRVFNRAFLAPFVRKCGRLTRRRLSGSISQPAGSGRQTKG